jgi:YgiT-type zinc finger domain-containing protein
MRCVICKLADVQPGSATVTLERGGLTLVVKHVPARVCPNCGEQYVDEQTAGHLLDTAERAMEAGVHVDVREYVAA